MGDIICAGITAAASIVCAFAAAALKRRDKAEDKRDQAEKARDEKILALCNAQKIVMLDRIRHLGQQYIEAGEVDFDDRRVLNAMHESYHNGLGGNGDADVIMRDVNALPLKWEKERAMMG